MVYGFFTCEKVVMEIDTSGKSLHYEQIIE